MMVKLILAFKLNETENWVAQNREQEGEHQQQSSQTGNSRKWLCNRLEQNLQVLSAFDQSNYSQNTEHSANSHLSGEI